MNSILSCFILKVLIPETLAHGKLQLPVSVVWRVGRNEKRISSATMFALEKTGGEQKRPPPVKVLSGQLRAAGNRAATERAGEGFVIRAGRGRSLRVSLVWMQGTVLEVQLERNTVLLMDETGTFTVQGVNNIPKGKPCLFPGKYVMVMGVVEVVSPEPVVRAVKMADLSDFAALHRQMWKLEVEELQQMLT